MISIQPNQLLEPIPGDDIGGTDMSFSSVFDEIREARREDDVSLAQGEWETQLKTAEWPKVKELTEDILCRQSKDMQVAAWYTEAMGRMKGFEGVSTGLRVMEGLIDEFWEFCYPSFDPDDLEERAVKIEWLNKQLAAVIREIPLTDRSSGGYSWLKWEESRAIDNLGLKDPAARDKAVADGKLSGEAFDKAVQASGRPYYEKLHARIRETVESAAALSSRVDERFGHDAPSLKDVQNALQACDELVGKLLIRLGGQMGTTAATNVDASISPKDAHRLEQTAQPVARTAGGIIVNRGDAIQALRDVAAYFRHNEPHSPVALLAERAASWAEMPLDQWLASVIKDQSTLGQLRELLAIPDPNR